MKNIIKRISFIAIACVLSVTGIVSYHTYENPKTTISQVTKTVNVTGSENVKMEFYSRVWHQKEDNPVFAIGELVNKCINYKIANPTDNDVSINFAIYRMEIETACYYIPGTRNYGKVTKLGTDYTDDCERISYSFIKAAKYGINVKLIYHRETNINDSKVLRYFQSYLNQNCISDQTKKVSDFLTVRKSEWPLVDLGVNQMHNKQLIVSDYLDYDGTIHHNAVFTATCNIDEYNKNTNNPIGIKDWTHTGFTISNHNNFYYSNLKYFNLTFENYKNRFEFVDAVLAEHAKGNFEDGGLNFKDEYIECYFTPMPQTYTDMYDLENNPYAYYFEKLKDCTGQIKCHMNMYHPSYSAMTERLFSTLVEAFNSNTNEGNEFGLKLALGIELNDELYELLSPIAAELELEKMTHAKDTMMYFGNTNEYVTITGSTNLHYGEFSSKSNTIVVFKETQENHDIYNFFLEAYNNTVRDTGYIWA